MRHVILFCALLILAACGGGGGGGAHPASDGHPAGVRSVPGGSITVSHATAVAAGQPCTLRVHVGGGPAPSSVSVWIGDDYAPPATPTVASNVGGGDYVATVVLPPQLAPGTAAWVRLTQANGSVIEAGRGCFELATLPAAP